ncbi:IclR family transcriptional regulator C-terminal domain-containing protein [Cupriavidus metallidurans]|uniref:IclR family transcriptional regulator domain-containing protein n=1 Tax=Cupriavidus metallidurans TaxID=119219 RepID=UPI001CCFFF03|nr:IclR family transcriptional regulator C-terminal domain-containing protein [Cupriavidus metallidurans]UBM09359.1 SMP-30/gluconolactonase/LRE family protein [Cupriavidus metallidurans]
MSANPGDGTGAIEKAIDVLEAVGAAPDGLSQTELTERLSLPRTTIYRLLATLVARGMLRRDPARKVYRLGFRCFEMARQAYTMPDLVAAAANEMRGLRDLTGETCYLATLDGLEVISLERCDGAHSERSAAALGQRKPLHCTSQGKAILSAMSSAMRDGIVRELALKPLTPLTITDRRRLNAELNITAARGYAIDDEEIVLGVRCVGAPIVDSQGAVRGAISVAGPAYRLTRQRLELLGPEIAEAARRVGAEIGALKPVAPSGEVQVVPGPWAFRGAFPFWNAAANRLVWADVLAPAVRCLDMGPDGAMQPRVLVRLEAPIQAMQPVGEELLVVHDNGATLVAADGGVRPAEAWPHAPSMMLALCAGPDNTLWAAVPAPAGGCRIGAWHRADGWQPLWVIAETVQALRWSDDGRHLYATTPESGSILVLDPESRAVRRLATVPKGAGRPHGLAIDDGGGIWTALCDGWSVMRFLPDGTLDRVVGTPVPCPSDVCVGGPAHDRLFITSSRQEVPLDVLGKAALSGCLFELHL